VHLILRILPAALLGLFANSAPAVPAAAGADWPTYQGSNSRSGVVAGAPAFSAFRRRFSRNVDGEVYAQPLIVRGVIYVATENNSVYAFRTNGQPLFQRHFGQPVPGRDLPCGNIDPSGITGTPAISGNRLYVVAFLASGHQHVLYALDTRSGRILMHRRVDAPEPLVEQERGALLVDHGRVYVPYGGLYGDCGPYHGYVVSVTTGGRGRRTYANPSSEAGIWAPGGISEGPSGALLVATGNGGGGSNRFEYSNSVLRLSTTLVREAFWAPRDWLSLSGSDTDVGSVAPLPVPGGMVFQSGKDGIGYLLSPALGGIGAEVHSARLCDSAFGALAVSPPFVIVPCAGALVAVRLEGNSFSVAWQATGQAGVPLIAGGVVIDLDKDSGRVRALRLSDGHLLGASDLGHSANSFPSGAASGDLLVEPSGSSITASGGI
jgi:outer membrane protein assembly factor BamB